jgi:glutathione S-transferase
MSASIKLTYFPLPGRAFAIRASLRHAKIDFIDNRLKGSEFRDEYKFNPKKCPLGSLPVLELPEGAFGKYCFSSVFCVISVKTNVCTFLVQSTALARWAAKKSDLYPSDDIAQLTVDEIMESANELAGKTGFDKDEAVKKAKRAEFVEKVLPVYMGYFQNKLERSKGPFFLGAKLSVADLVVFATLNGIYTGNWDYVPADVIEKSYPAIHAWYSKVVEHPISKAELEAKI